ncbi:MAG: phosphatidylcholine synthase [Planctomycetota bacterium]|nr:MAG: phosphatidylcholine synthase [Planctomycetota bacterium]
MDEHHDEPARRRIAGWLVHVYTAAGAWVGLMAAIHILSGDNRSALLWLTLAVLIDASDGWLARRLQVKALVPSIDGARLDDIVDYVTFTFLPILMIYRSGWLPYPAELWTFFPLVTSLLAFANVRAKEGGFFRGFPSYWNIVAFYIAIWLHAYGPWVVLGVVLALSCMSILPVRFVYPTRTPRMAFWFVLGGLLWLPIIALILGVFFPDPPNWLLMLSLVYPGFYVVLSIYMDVADRRQRSR